MITHLIRAPAVRGPVLCSRYASRRLDQTGLHVRVVHSVHANAMPSCARFSLTSPSPSLRSMTTIDTHSDSPSQRARCGATVLCLLRAHGCTRHSASLLLDRRPGDGCSALLAVPRTPTLGSAASASARRRADAVF
ncbi:hypothetical protein BDA96_04G361800 [Sorghum bicolor]|uniref:Uncharacterized protein n=2 Tax=Sorghum bicolor TaxID=4558 RepID=A0A921R8L5_SORBI|nr:hypothetical protein BDA96_04G361800 [Sorghum bicolor]OQU85919.1 hypothetical protein SORBI_3004G337950 [Sorghum bicolor]